MGSEKEDLFTGMETLRDALKQLEAHNQDLQRQLTSLDKDLLAERAMKEQKIKVEEEKQARYMHRIKLAGLEYLTMELNIVSVWPVREYVCLLAGPVICHEGSGGADSSAPQAAAAVTADCPGAGAAPQGAHTHACISMCTNANTHTQPHTTPQTLESQRACPVKRLCW